MSAKMYVDTNWRKETNTKTKTTAKQKTTWLKTWQTLRTCISHRITQSGKIQLVIIMYDKHFLKTQNEQVYKGESSY